MSVFDVRGFGRLEAHAPRKGERSEVDPFQTRARVEILVAGSQVAAIVETIRQSARTGHAGDGIIFVTDVGWALRIWDGTQGLEALGLAAED